MGRQNGWKKTPRLLALAIATIVPSYAGNIVVNGGFETTNLSGWTQFGNIGFSGVECPGAGIAIEGSCDGFFGPVGSVGGISQVLTTQIGQTYAISFDLQPDGGNVSSFSALFGGTTLISLSNPAATSPAQLYNFAVAATSTSTTLAFNFRDDPGFFRLDAVSVQTAPEPATVALVGIGIASLLFWRRLG